tara:strand:- start:459 stop:566 length:108 start_codon:yes stop_codon:yes gene_type:complete
MKNIFSLLNEALTCGRVCNGQIKTKPEYKSLQFRN